MSSIYLPPKPVMLEPTRPVELPVGSHVVRSTAGSGAVVYKPPAQGPLQPMLPPKPVKP